MNITSKKLSEVIPFVDQLEITEGLCFICEQLFSYVISQVVVVDHNILIAQFVLQYANDFVLPSFFKFLQLKRDSRGNKGWFLPIDGSRGKDSELNISSVMCFLIYCWSIHTVPRLSKKSFQNNQVPNLQI